MHLDVCAFVCVSVYECVGVCVCVCVCVSECVSVCMCACVVSCPIECRSHRGPTFDMDLVDVLWMCRHDASADAGAD